MMHTTSLFPLASLFSMPERGRSLCRRCFGGCRVALLAMIFVTLGGRIMAQPADEMTGVSVTIKGFGLAWNTNPSATMTMSISAFNGLKSADANRTETATEQILARLIVGKVYTLGITQVGMTSGTIMAAPPPGYTMEIEGTPREQIAVSSPVGIKLRVRPPADAAPGRAGVATALGVERTLWQASIGSLSNGESAGAIGFIDDGTQGDVASIFKPSGLVYDSPSSEVLVLMNPAGIPAPYVAGTVRQIIAPEVCVNVHMDTQYQCQMQFYHRAQLGAAASNGIYAFNGDPFAWYFFNPNGPNLNSMLITCHLRNTTGADPNGRPIVLPPQQPVVRVKATSLERTTSGSNSLWTAKEWCDDPLTAPVTVQVRSRNGTSESVTTSASITSPPGTPPVFSMTRTYASQAWGGDDVVSETVGTNAASQVITDYDYWSPSDHELATWGRLRSQFQHGGHWSAYEYYDYSDGNSRAGVLKRQHRPFKDSDVTVPVNLTAHQGEITTFQWDPDAFGRATRVTSSETTVGGHTTAKTTVGYTNASPGTFPGHTQLQLVVATRTDYSATVATLTTITKYFQEDTGVAAPTTDDFFRLKIHSMQAPDDTLRVFAYQRGTWDGSSFTLSGNNGLDAPAGAFGSRIAVITGIANSPTETRGTLYPSYNNYDIEDVRLIDGKSTLQVIIRDNYARVVREESYVYHQQGGPWYLVGAVNYDWNFSNQLLRRATNDSTSFNLTAGAVYQASYLGEHVTSTTDEGGVVMNYDYDAADRVEVVTKVGVSPIGALATKFVYDPAGHITEKRRGWTQAEQIVSSRGYDDAGRVISETIPGPGGAITTSYVYEPASRRATVNAPLGRSRIETYYADGSLYSVTGSAVVAEYYSPDVLADGTRYMRLNLGGSSSPRLREAWSDWLGRSTKTSRPGFTGQSAFVELFTYDAAGKGRATKSARQDASGNRLFADTLYEYDELGQMSRAGLRLPASGLLDLASDDRVGDSNVSFEQIGSDWWLTSTAKTYPTSSNATPLSVSTTRQRLTGFSVTLSGFTGVLLSEAATTDADGNTTRTQTFVDRATATAKVVTTNSTITDQQTQTFVNGLLTSTRQPTITPEALVYTVGYDGLHRRSTSTDPRTGATTTYYEPGTTFVRGIWGPRSATGDYNYLATYGYDGAGRVISVTDAALNITRTEYNTRDQVLHRWGTGTYPVEFGYDSTYGDRTSMKTYRAGLNWADLTWPGDLAPNNNQNAPDNEHYPVSTTSWGYDAASGFLSTKTFPKLQPDNAVEPFRTVAFTYNARGQVLTRTWSRGVVTTYAYFGDTAGDPFTGELKSISYSDGTPGVAYAYTRAGQISTVKDATSASASDLRVFNYGGVSNSNALELGWVTLPTFYGSNRRLTRVYDTVHRAGGFQLGTSANPTADLSQGYSYDTLGRFQQLSTASAITPGSRTFTYSYFQFNAGLQVRAPLVGGYATTKAGEPAFAVSYDYEPYRDLRTKVDSTSGTPSVTRYDYTYNALGQADSAKQTGDAFADLGGATYYRYGYDGRGELTSAVDFFGPDPSATGTPQLTGRRLAYMYDAIGNRQSSTRSLGTSVNDVFTSNTRNQYTSRENDIAYTGGTVNTSSTIAITGGTATATVGRAGGHWGAEVTLNNLSAPAATSLTIKASLPGSPTLEKTELRTAILPIALQPFTYDDDGNLTRDGMWVYEWDAENRLTQMYTCGAPSLDPLYSMPANAAVWNSGVPRRWLKFKYDYLGRRVQKQAWDWIGSGWSVTSERRYLYDGWDLVAEFAAPGGTTCGSLVRSYTWGLDVADSLGATGGVGALVQMTDHVLGTAYFPTYDGNGNVASLVRTDGVIAAKYEYTPFGETLRNEVKSDLAQAERDTLASQPFRFSTKFTDAETGLVYYGARYYSAALGRFINRDPITENGGANLYGFTGNDPINGSDYLGMWYGEGGGGYGCWGGGGGGGGGGIVISGGGGSGGRGGGSSGSNRVTVGSVAPPSPGMLQRVMEVVLGRSLPSTRVQDVFGLGGYSRSPLVMNLTPNPNEQVDAPKSGAWSDDEPIEHLDGVDRLLREASVGRDEERRIQLAMLGAMEMTQKVYAETVANVAGGEVAVIYIVRGVRYVRLVRAAAAVVPATEATTVVRAVVLGEKMAIIGRGMDRVRSAVVALKAGTGAAIEVFKPSKDALAEFDALAGTLKAGERLSEAQIRATKLFKENLAWAQKLVREGYTVLDAGSAAGATSSAFYDMERLVIYGGTL